MVVSSRTPEGQPQLCPICGALVTTTPDTPFGDSTCSRCGALLAQLSDSLQARLRQWIEQLGPDGFITRDGGLDSLDTVELVIELEEELNLDIPMMRPNGFKHLRT